MKNLRITALLMLMAIIFQTKGQDVHFSQYNFNPVHLNPALTGFQQGNLRLNGNYRNQWFSASSFSTYAFSADANIAREKLKMDMLGVGLSFFQDIEEQNGFSNTNIQLSVAYNIRLTKRPLQYLGFGIQPSLLRKQINLSDAVYGTLFETGVNTDPLGFSEFGGFKFNLNMGLTYYVFIREKHALSTGFTMSHITRPNYGLIGADNLFRKYTVYFNSELELGKSGLSWLKPAFYVTKQGPSTEFTPSLGARFKFYNAVNDVFFGFGTSVRMVGHDNAKLKPTDFIGHLNFTIEQFTLGFSYDMVISNLRDVAGRNGGPEISLIADLDFSRRRLPRSFKIMTF